MSKNIDFPQIKTNTVELERGLYPNWKIPDFCDNIISWEEFDNSKDFFSLENKKNAFWDNYKEENIIEIPWNLQKKEIKIPSIIIWGMWTNVSSASLNQAVNEIWFSSHLSSIWIWIYYFYENYKKYFKADFTWNKSLENIVINEFDNIFKNELWLKEEFIKKHKI